VAKLFKAAAQASADNVILTVENANLRSKATSAEDRAKVRSRKELSKARVISVEDVVRIRTEEEEREKILMAKKKRAADRKAQTSLPKTNKKSKSDGRTGPQTRRGKNRKDISPSPVEIISSDDSEWDEIDAEWVVRGSLVDSDNMGETIILQPSSHITRSHTRVV
jgi:hypothetical protein